MRKFLGVLGLVTILATTIGASAASAGIIKPHIPECYWNEYGEYVCPA